MSRGSFMAGFAIGGLLTLIALSGIAFADTNVEIARPLDGSTVREVVNIMVPVPSVPQGGFVAVMIDGRFRSASASKSADNQHFVYSWDTKADDPDTKLRPEQRAASDGPHTIAVQAHDSRGRKVGEPKEITVYVRNSASNLMPAEGLLLRYAARRDQESKFRFKNTIDLKRIQGATSIGATLGESIEGASGVVRRSIEDVMPDSTALIRQKLDSILEVYTAGQPTPLVGLQTRSVYQIEDTRGRNVHALRSISSGVPVSVDLPNLPAQRVRIGDSWTQTQRIFRNVLTGGSVAVSMTSTLEGLEWHRGYPCAKIRSEFSGMLRVPFSNTFQEPVTIVNGEMVTHFAWQVGKLVSSVITAEAKASMDPATVSSLTQHLVPAGAIQQPRTPMPTAPTHGFPGIEGPPGMTGAYIPPGPTHRIPLGTTAPGYGGMMGDMAPATTEIDLVIRQVVEIVD